MRRAIALFVDDKPHLLANSRWLYESWAHIKSDDTDLVFMGPKRALEKLPDMKATHRNPWTDIPTYIVGTRTNSFLNSNALRALTIGSTNVT